MLTRTLFALVLLSKPFVCVPQAKEAASDAGTTTDTSTGTTTTTGDIDTTDSTVTTSTETTGVPAMCGNGEVEGGEECDDGNDDNTDACLINCIDAFCGDDFVQAGVEECDDGDQLDTNDCTAACKKPYCGDGFEHEGVEECDDGNDVDTDDCTSDCKAPVCGDGILTGTELCDDGPANLPKETAQPTDCTTDCRPACGDGTVSTSEECDDMNDALGDGCTPTCEHEYLMFATKEVFSANLGGVAGADQNCQSAATAANLPGTYVAWISIEGADASADLPAGEPLFRLDGLPIVTTASDLHKGGATTLMNPINLAEDGSPVEGYAWTGTSFTGQASGSDCTGWTMSNMTIATIGNSNSSTSTWTNDSGPDPFTQVQCIATNRLFCFRKLEP
ncbi:DUF4215 domain-containing protein [Nannocystis punicea]|uniref:DUF4215 domain-containing protein n=1 Tax=Nannocystis punicea TaxID=2995304 RepID=A0ABY7H3I3_9BACT|nr:DUF4215 domain-containing protein [Nannocystis poenicansa]WAS93589.1 DUF4215 domain-containing protein [Nannocystis poenicansa]